MISIVLLLPFFFNNLYCMNCIYNVVVVVVENKFQFNSIQFKIQFSSIKAQCSVCVEHNAYALQALL